MIETNGQKEPAMADVRTHSVPIRDIVAELTMLQARGPRTLEINGQRILATDVFWTPDAGIAARTARQDCQRRVHNSAIGFIDPAQSADTGAKVGIARPLPAECTMVRAPPAIQRKFPAPKKAPPTGRPVKKRGPRDRGNRKNGR